MDNVKIVPAQIETNKVVIAFSAAGTEPGNFNFSKNIGSGYHKIFLRNHEDDWYLNGISGVGGFEESIAFLAEACQELTKEPTIYTTGSSMGAYAAILYGHHLAAESVLSFSSEYDLTLESSRAFGKALQGETDLSFLLDSKTKVLLCGGKYDPLDVYAIIKLRGLRNVTAALFDSDHRVLEQ